MKQNNLSNRLIYKKFVDLRTNSKERGKPQEVKISLPSERDLALEFYKQENKYFRKLISDLKNQNNKLRVIAYQNITESNQKNQNKKQQFEIENFLNQKKSKTRFSNRKQAEKVEEKKFQENRTNPNHQFFNRCSCQPKSKNIFNQTTALSKNHTFTLEKSKQLSNANKSFTLNYQYINSFNKEDKKQQDSQLHNLMVPQFIPEIINLNTHNDQTCHQHFQLLENQKKQIDFLKLKIKGQFQKIMTLEAKIKKLQDNSLDIRQHQGLFSFPKVKNDHKFRNLLRSERNYEEEQEKKKIQRNCQSYQNNDRKQRENSSYPLQMMIIQASTIQNLLQQV